MRIIFRALSYVVHMLGTTLLLLVISEAALQLIKKTELPHVEKWDTIEGTGYTSEDELRSIKEEDTQATWGMGRYFPYVEWIRNPFRGRFLTINKDGQRRTVNRRCNNPLIIHVYGGSTVWGTGVRDEHTIPSWLSRLASQENSKCVRVDNFGEGGYVTSQDLNRFVTNIRAGKAPHVAVFYAGINDSYVAYQQIPASFPQAFHLFAERLDSSNNTFWGLAIRLVKSSEVHGIIQPAVSALRSDTSQLPDEAKLREAAEVFCKNFQLAETLADAHGIKTIFILQPCLQTTGKRLTSRERRILESLDKNLVTVFVQFYSVLHSECRAAHFIDLATMFDKWPENVFIDRFHLTPFGNREIARQIYEALR